MATHRAIVTLVPMQPGARGHGDPRELGRELREQLDNLLSHFHVRLDDALLDDACSVEPCDAVLERRPVRGIALGLGVHDAGGERPYRAAWNAHWLALALAIDHDAVNQRAQGHGFFSVQPEDPAAVIARGPVLIEAVVDDALDDDGEPRRTLVQVVRADDGAVRLVSDDHTLAESDVPLATAEAARAALWAHRGTDRMTSLLWPTAPTERGLCGGLAHPDACSSALWYLGKLVRPTAYALEQVLAAPYAPGDVAQARDVAAHLARALGDPALAILRPACDRSDVPGALALWALARFALGRTDAVRAEAEERVAQALGSPSRLHCEQALELVGSLRLRGKAVVAAAALRAADPDDDLAHAALLGLFNLFHREPATPAHVTRAFQNAARREDKIGAFARWALGALPSP